MRYAAIRPIRRFASHLTLLALAAAAAAQEPTTAIPATLPSFEAAFWQCDYDATEHGMDRVDTAGCRQAYELVKERKFGGDFERLLAWWQLNKPIEHAKLRDRAVLTRPR